MKSNTIQPAQVPQHNQAIKTAYFKILKDTLQLLGTLEEEALRCSFIRNIPRKNSPIDVQHEIISPIIYLSLQKDTNDKLRIQFGFEMMDYNREVAQVTSGFLRLLYKFTGIDNTPVDIESCVDTGHVFTDCSSIYEQIESRHHHAHTFKQIPYKAMGAKRKQHLRVA